MIRMKNAEYLIGNAEIEKSPIPTFSDDACNLLRSYEAAIRRDREARAFPDVIAVGYWCRNANIQSKKEAFGNTAGCVGRGLAFHITPGNIPVNFMFSYLFSLLAGNANIVRIPSKPFPQIGILLRILKQCLSDFPEIEKRTAFVSYPSSEDAITAEFCKEADVRVIWGGDETVRRIRAMEAKPRCIDIAFADRFSVAVLSGSAVENASDAELARLAHAFYNDTYLMDQNACSSPRLCLWTDESKTGKARFWNAVYLEARKRYQLQGALAVDKYTRLCEDVMDRDDLAGVLRMGNLLHVVTLSEVPQALSSLEGKGGYFYECALTDLSQLARFLDSRVQTVGYFGMDAAAIRDAVVSLHLTGADRIVPIGSAMDIDSDWDGFDLIRTMSRRIVAN